LVIYSALSAETKAKISKRVQLTRSEEEAGLYEDPTTIGFKLNWERLLEEKGLVVRGKKREVVPAEKRSRRIQKGAPG